MIKKLNVVVLFGGVSPEHEVSIITGLQVIENMDKNRFNALPIKMGQDGLFYFYHQVSDRKKYLKVKPKIVNFGKDKQGVYFYENSLFGRKNYFDCVYLAFHGGLGESGQIQGFFDILSIPYTSTTTESSSICMNKALTKELLEKNGIKTIKWTRVFDYQVNKDVDKTINRIVKDIGQFPVIIKPVHLGSSIGINIAKNKIELKKYLLESSHLDTEILVEKFVDKFEEFNVSVRQTGEDIEISQIERPISKDMILSFADKYQRGGKKTGGMASLDRELPAKISKKIKTKIQSIATQAFEVVRAKGMLRIDFMLINETVYVSEINPIPGSMSFYLWEASGISFKDQITQLILKSIQDFEKQKSKNIKYESDIVEKFVNNKDH